MPAVVTYPCACSTCGGSGSLIVVPRFCPRHLEIWNLKRAECPACRGTGRRDTSEPSDVALAAAWERGEGFHVPQEARQDGPARP